MNTAGAVTLAGEFFALAAIVLALFRYRRLLGPAPLYVMLGAFQPVQVILAATVYVEVWPGVLVSPGNVMFAISLLVLFLVYIREDALEARRFIYCIVGANVLMTIVLAASGERLGTAGTINVLGVSPSLFAQGARVTLAGTLVLVADVLLMILAYGFVRRVLPRAALARAWLTLTAVMLFDGAAFTLGAFAGNADLPRILLGALAAKAIVGTLAALAAVAYLRFVEPPGDAAAVPDLRLRDIFYSLSYRDRFELQASRTAAVEAELSQVFQRIGDAVVAIDASGRYTFANDIACRIIGLPREALLGMSMNELLGDGAQGLRSAVHEAMRTQQPQVVNEFYEPLGSYFESRIYPSRDGVTIYFSDVTERNRQREELRERADSDELTGLLNRRAFRDAVDDLIAATPGDSVVGLVVLNLDRMHHINNTLGYEAGDQLLQQVAGRLASTAAARADVVARIGGDEFAIAGRVADVAAIEAAAHDLVAGFRSPFRFQGEQVHITCSAGVAWSPDAGRDAAALLRAADLTLNVAKQRGRDQAVLFSPERVDRLRHRMAMTAELRAAAETPQVDLVFQPVVDAASGAIVAAEALMRWTSPRLGAVSPVDFIPVAEDTGLIIDLGYLAVRRALLYVRGWRADGLATVPVAVNVSPVQFRHERFIGDVVRALEDAGATADALKLEITESAFIEDLPTAVAVLSKLRDMGVRISLDDFGTGYSSLALLRQLPLDEIKIDRSFVAEATVSHSAATLCRTVVSMSHDLGLSVVAEGVETPAQCDYLRAIGCDLMQGFHFSVPLPADDFSQRFLQAGS